MRRALDLIYTCSCAASPRKGTKGKPHGVALPPRAAGSQPAFEKPATASEIPHRLTGALIGAVIELQERTEIFPYRA
jgi:hypothetical protein